MRGSPTPYVTLFTMSTHQLKDWTAFKNCSITNCIDFNQSIACIDPVMRVLSDNLLIIYDYCSAIKVLLCMF